nr:GspH/FimT family pseudopilin [Aquitalea sp. LB_tupeE]
MIKSAGYTLFELVIVMVIASIITAIAVAGYRTTLDSSNVSAEINALSADLAYARNEAIKQGQNVLLCATSNPASSSPTCNNASSLATGWVVMLSGNSNTCTVSNGLAASAVLRVGPAVTTGDSITFAYSGSNTSNGICFSRLGTGTTGKFTVAAATASSSANQFNKQCLYVSNAGLLHVVKSGSTDSFGSC